MNGVRILVVEDAVKGMRALREGLEAEHHDVVVSDTGEDAFCRVNAEAFDVVVRDLMLPGRDGIESMTTLRKRELRSVPAHEFVRELFADPDGKPPLVYERRAREADDDRRAR